MPEPEVSFIIPAHNESNYIPATLDAIRQAADRLEIQYEMIVVNDDSSDNTRELALEHGASTIDVKLRNIGAVRNAGALQAKSPWLIFVDADTILPQETLKATLEALTRGDVGGGALVQISQEKALSFTKILIFKFASFSWLKLGKWAAGCYMFCRKHQFDEFGGFNENYFAAEEWFFSRELKSRGRFTLVKTPVITSARKLHNYSSWQLFRFVCRPMLEGKNRLKSKTGLEILYEDRR